MSTINVKGGKKLKRNYPIFDKGKNASKETEDVKRKKTSEPLKIWTWNVAGLRACVKKGAYQRIIESNADIVLLEETKTSEFPDELLSLDEYQFKRLLGSQQNKGHAGIAMLSKEKPIKVEVGIGSKEFDEQGRLIQAEFPTFFFVGVYVPNSGRGLVNLDKRAKWDELMLSKLQELDKQKPVVYCGDMNVAHQEIDLRNPGPNRNKTAGFTDQEREAFARLLESGPFVDVYRRRNPTETGAYTFWSHFGNSRARNVGWRLDYFVVSERIFSQVQECQHHPEIMGSDHCPISMVINI